MTAAVNRSVPTQSTSSILIREEEKTSNTPIPVKPHIMPANAPGGPISMMAFYIDDQMFDNVNYEGKIFKATMSTSINPTELASLGAVKVDIIIKSKRIFVCKFVNRKLTDVFMDPSWIAKIKAEGSYELVMNVNKSAYFHMTTTDKPNLIPMNETGYFKTIANFKIKA